METVTEDDEDEASRFDPMSFNQTPTRLLSSSDLSSTTPVSSPVLSEIVSKTKNVALDKLTNIEFWIKHVEDCLDEAGLDGDPELSRTFIKELLEIINVHLSKTYPSNVTSDETKKNFFPKLADILIKRLPALFGDYLNMEEEHTEEDENVNSDQWRDETESHDDDEKIIGKNIIDTEDSFIWRLTQQHHGRHELEVKRDKKGGHVIRCDGFYFRSRSNATWRNNFFKCTFRTCKSFIKIKNGVMVKYPSRGSHLNHPIPKTLRLLKESQD